MGAKPTEKKSKCGILGTMFRTCKFWPAKRSLISTRSLPRFQNNNNNNVKASPLNVDDVNPPSKSLVVHQQNPVREPPVKAAIIPKVNQRKVPKEAISISGESVSMIVDHQQMKSESVSMIVDHQQMKSDSKLVRASSGNFMLNGHLENLSQPVVGNTNACHKVEKLPEQGSPCKALSNKMDPEKLKIMGNEDYKKGKFEKALSLYEAAIAIDPLNASYRIEKSAVLEASGRILEAVSECNAAIRIKPCYLQAHHHLAKLYLRLGEVEKTKYHFKRAGAEANQDDIARARTLEQHLNKCNEAKRFRKWNAVLEETDAAIKAGADSSPHIFALKAEALLKLHRHPEANEALKGMKFNDDDGIKHLGPIGVANLLVVQAQVDMALGRFDDAMAAIERAVRLDSKSKEVNSVMSKARAVTTRRLIGNEYFKSSNFYDACITYGEALEHDPDNSVLLHNRAACYSRLGQYELAIEDCTRALSVFPGYTKARLERANCNYKLARCEAAIEDYEILKREMPGNQEVIRGWFEAQGRLKDKKKKVRWKHLDEHESYTNPT